VPLALKAHATCLIKCRITRIVVKGGRAVGAQGTLLLEDGTRRGLRINARAVVLACGSVYTPMLLLKNDLCNQWDQVGRHLTIHPALGVSAAFDKEIRGWEGIPQGYCVDHFKHEGILYEGAFVPLEFAAMALPMVGPSFTEAMDAYNKLAIFGFMISDSNTGRVRRGVADRPLITYMLTRHDIDRFQRGAGILGDIYFAAGAKKIYAPIAGFEVIESREELERLKTARLHGWDLELSAYHPLGTCRIGVDPRTSVTDGNHESFEVQDLYVVDGSSVPSALGVNPQVTIMALATRFAEQLHERL